MRENTTKSVPVPSVRPATAYAEDMARLDQDHPFGASDDAWLVLAHALHTFSDLSSEELAAVVPRAADSLAVSALASGLGSQSTTMRAARALRGLLAVNAQTSSQRDAVAELVISIQAVSEEQELAGASGLAYATLSGVLSALGDRIEPRLRGNVLAQQGRATRQLGAVDVARELYEEALAVGYECEALDVVSKALLGLGVLASTSGNYPLAREQFERALLNADRSADPELVRAAHHGLLSSAIGANDLDAALIHGWNAMRLSITPELRAEALMNMAEICRLTSEHDAALRTYRIAADWTTRRHVRLHALSGALQSAVALRRHDEARLLLGELELVIPTVTDFYSRAMVGVEMAEALELMDEHVAAVGRLNTAMAIASENGFHKVIHRAEQVASKWHFAPSKADKPKKEIGKVRPHRSAHFRMVVRTLRGLSLAAH